MKSKQSTHQHPPSLSPPLSPSFPLLFFPLFVQHFSWSGCAGSKIHRATDIKYLPKVWDGIVLCYCTVSRYWLLILAIAVGRIPSNEQNENPRHRELLLCREGIIRCVVMLCDLWDLHNGWIWIWMMKSSMAISEESFYTSTEGGSATCLILQLILHVDLPCPKPKKGCRRKVWSFL